VINLWLTDILLLEAQNKGRCMSDVLTRANARRTVALEVLQELRLVERWSEFGRPVIVGAVAYDLVVSSDIDMEVYCPHLRIEDGFEVLRACALHPRVRKARFLNELHSRNKALYWQLRYVQDDGDEWKIDMWSVPEDYKLPRAENLVDPMRRALSEETRRAILELKEYLRDTQKAKFPSVDLYRAVLDDGVRSSKELLKWLRSNSTGQLTGWRPVSKT